MATVPAWALVVQGIRYHDLSLGPLVGVVCFTNWCCVFHKANCAKEMHVNDVFAINLSIYIVAEPPELSRLKCAGHHPKGNTGSNALQTEQFLVCRVTSRYNHRISDRTSIPRTKASSEILQPQFYNTGIVKITNQFKRLLQNPLK